MIRPRPWAGWALALTLLAPASRPAFASHAQHPPEAEFSCPGTARFSPHGGAEALVVDTLTQARVSVRIAIYGLTSRKIEQALLDLARAGVRVSIKADHLQSAGKTQAALLARLRAAGIEVEVSRVGRLLHDKFAIVDGRWVVTGSFNWTEGAEGRNRENILAFDCPALASAFEAEWETIRPDDP
ncbi:MAG: phospholipase D family protein [Candidatus Rokuibacteriota bacterium]|nr:MAG: phospholipase D family protein [Candidatus Rokubacteria bacterium]PYM58049.1 MAG: phospholipase D family protein [Candidatus Rokubacteria bacterium]PYM76351.1 MAG: phospholipase D family protein [Candidatus Rokubacteria bacterium]